MIEQATLEAMMTRLCDEVQRLRAENARLRAVVEAARNVLASPTLGEHESALREALEALEGK